MTFLQESYDIKVCQGIILPLMELLTIIPLYTHHYPIIVRIEKSHHSQGIMICPSLLLSHCIVTPGI